MINGIFNSHNIDDGLQLYKDEVLSCLARTLIINSSLGPPAMTPWGDHILEPCGFVLYSMAGASVTKMGPGSLALTGDAHLTTSPQLFCFLRVSASPGPMVHSEYHAVLVIVIFLLECLEVLPDVILVCTQLAVLARQQHGRLSKSSTVMFAVAPLLPCTPPILPASLGLVQIRTRDTSIALLPGDSPVSIGCSSTAGGTAWGPGGPVRHLAVKNSAKLLKITAAVPHVQAAMVTIARLITKVDHNAVRISLLYRTVSVLPITTLPFCSTASLQGEAAPRQHPQGCQHGPDLHISYFTKSGLL